MYSKLFFYFVFIMLISSLNAQTLLKDIEDLTDTGSSPSNFSSVTDELFIFQASNVLESNFLYASDGTEEGTIGLGTYQVDTDIIQLGDRAFFGGCNILFSADSCASLYISDGTIDGTNFFYDLEPGGVSLGIEDIVVGDSLFFFSAHRVSTGYELWRSNGTVDGTYMIDDIASGTTSGYYGELAVIDDIAYFSGYTDEFGTEAWRSDGTIDGTYMIVDLNEGTGNGFPSGFTKSGGFIYFSGLGTDTGFEVRRTTGEQGNVEIIGERSGSTDSSIPRDFVDSDGRLYYAAEGEDAAGFDLFVYDHVGDPFHIEFNSGDIFPRALMPFGDGELIFNAEDDAGRELWRSDGTLNGTHKILDLYPGDMDGVFGTGAVNESFYVYNDSLVYFAGADGVNAAGEFIYELFVTDGTEEGTHLISDHYPGTQGSNPGNFFEFGNRIYFAATDPDVDREPFYLDAGVTSSLYHQANNIKIFKSPYPNPLPFGKDLQIDLNLSNGSNLYAQLFNLMGQPVQEGLLLGYFAEGNHQVNIPIGDHLIGLYQLTIKGNHDRMSFLIMLGQ